MIPEQFKERVRLILKDEYEDFIKSYELNNHRALRVNTLKGSIDYFLKTQPWGVRPEDAVSWCDEGFYFTDPAIGTHPYHAAGAYYIQEPSAMLPVEKLDVKEGMKALDLCASPGGKSTQIAAKLKGSGLLVANEIISSRAEVLSENIERMGVSNCLVLSHEPGYIAERFPGYFDRVLVDAPCSGEGMFRKNPEALENWSVSNVEMCAQRSRDILDKADKVLKPGGRLVYSTCTFAPEEDEECIEEFLKGHAYYRLEEQLKLWPHKIKGEGHFCAVLTKDADAPSEEQKQKTIKGLNEKSLKEYREFEKENLKIKAEDIFREKNAFILYGPELYLVKEDYPDLKGLRVLRPGLHLGTLKKDRFEPSFAFSHFLKKEDVVRETAIDTETAVQYIKGLTFPEEGEKGYHLITTGGYALSWGKLSNGVMKNHYPKGLRK
ncbi:MAG: RsmB/NOP family class I SAM-dependent RNA methyltransferase [Lachnospiraceae bacterium]|nr:RsmB/NOP family class I SAM-dependent RNA methyltransferase [Lachnospiraceae bacterium]